MVVEEAVGDQAAQALPAPRHALQGKVHKVLVELQGSPWASLRSYWIGQARRRCGCV